MGNSDRQNAARGKDLSPRWSLFIFVVLVAIASARIAATYTVFNDTVDESQHIACGMQWIDQKAYRYEPGNPPLARIMAAAGPYLAGARSTGEPSSWVEGTKILTAFDRYDRNLARARLGILPFFWLACAVVYAWTARVFGNLAACFAVLCFTSLPAALAHAGLATTDMAATATIGAAFLAMLLWVQQPSWRHTAILGTAVGVAVLSKFTALVFLPAAVLTLLAFHLLFHRPRLQQLFDRAGTYLLPLLAATVLACTILWAGYRFSFAGVPAPELWQGISTILEKNKAPFPSYLFGQYSEHGWWYYFPVALAVKTPLAWLALALLGSVLCWKKGRETGSACHAPLAYALGILLFAMALSRVNVGIRHILPMFIGLSVVAGVAAQHLWQASCACRMILSVLLVWMVTSSALSHPDYLAYFNVLAGKYPEKILVDSDLDWGQDTKRLALRLGQLGAKEVAFLPFNRGYVEDLESRGLFPKLKPLSPFGPSPGWNAASITMLKLFRLGVNRNDPSVQLWTDRIPPTERIGKGILLWYAPENF